MTLIVIGSVAAGVLIGVGISIFAKVTGYEEQIKDAYERGLQDGQNMKK